MMHFNVSTPTVPLYEWLWNSIFLQNFDQEYYGTLGGTDGSSNRPAFLDPRSEPLRAFQYVLEKEIVRGG